MARTGHRRTKVKLQAENKKSKKSYIQKGTSGILWIDNDAARHNVRKSGSYKWGIGIVVYQRTQSIHKILFITTWSAQIDVERQRTAQRKKIQYLYLLTYAAKNKSSLKSF